MGTRYRKFRDEPLVRQWILQDHMRNHYRKLEIVKPRTISTFPKQNRSKNATFSCPCCSRLAKLGEERLTDSLNNLSIASLEHRLTALESSNRAPFRSSHIQVSPCHSAPSQIYSQKVRKPTTQHRSWSVADSGRPPFSTNWTEQREQLQKTVMSGDLLERHANYFQNPPAPFTPKTLRKVAQSKLIGSRNYNPPCRYVKVSYPQPSMCFHYSEHDGTIQRNDATEKSSSDEQDIEELRSRSKSTGVRATKKKLYDGDKQTSHSGYQVQNRQSERSKADSSSGRNSSGRDSAYGEVSSISSRNATPAGKFWEGHESPLLHGTNDVWFKDHFGKWVDKQEHEHKYLTFLCEVTADLLTRGLCTNKKIKEIISWHINRKRQVLNAECVASLMQQLCLDLQVPWDNKHDGEFYGCRMPERNTPEDDKPNMGSDDMTKTNRCQQAKQAGPGLSKANNNGSVHIQRGAKTIYSPCQATYAESNNRPTRPDNVRDSTKREKSFPHTGKHSGTHVVNSDKELNRHPQLPQRGNYKDKWSSMVENNCIPKSSASLKESSPVAGNYSDCDSIPDMQSCLRKPDHSDARSTSSSRASSVYYNKGDEVSYNEPKSSKGTTGMVPPTETKDLGNDYANENYSDDDISEVMELGSSNSDNDSNKNQV